MTASSHVSGSDILSRMSLVKFTGYITPPVLLLRLKGKPATFPDPTLGTASMKFSIEGSIINAECEIETVNDETMTVLHWFVIARIGSAVDAIAFSRGIGVTVIMDHCEMPDGRKGPIGLRDDDLMNICSSITEGDIFEIGSQQGAVFKLIQDLVWSVFRPLDAPINCARAVEGFRTLMYPIPPDQEPERGRDQREWLFMQEHLNLSVDYLKFITDLSKGPRHGKVGTVRIGDIGETRLRGWTVAIRFIEFRKRGSVKLLDPEFQHR